jgi:flavodoxin/ferredoxin
MKCIVIYHSISGNTKKIAQAIHAGMSKTGEQCDLVRLKDVKPPDLKNYDLIGIGSPIQHRRELFNVTNFVEYALENVEGKHGFAFCTHGALPAHYLSRMVPAMRQRGLVMVGWNDWFGTVYHPGCPKPYFTDGHPDEVDLKEAEEFGREMVERSRRIYKGEKGLVPEFPTGKVYDDIYDPSTPPPTPVHRHFKKVENLIQFKVDKEKCNYPKCTLCIDTCPMGSIDFSGPEPIFNINCEKCFSCISTCPRGAIFIDNWQPYHEAHYPMVLALEEALDLFEKRGKFRRLVPNDKIGWDTFQWQKKTPWFKVP